MSPSLIGALYGWLVALGFVALQVGLGRRARIRAGEQLESTDLQELLLSFLVGFWVTSVVAMALAACGQLNAVTVSLYALAALALSCNRELLRRVTSSRARKQPWGHRPVATGILMFALFVAVVLPLFLRTLVPNSDWDSASTHLPLAHWFVDNGLRSIPLEYSNLIIPGNVHLIYAMFLAVGAETAIVPLNLVVSILTCAAAAAVARHFWGRIAGWWACGVALSTHLILVLGLDARIDGFLAFFSTMAAMGVMIWVLEGQEKRWLLLAGIALVCALGTKYTAVFPLALWGLPVAFVGLRQWRHPPRVEGRGWLLVVLVLMIPSGYWYASNVLRFGDPMYPQLSGNLIRSSAGNLIPVRPAVDELLLNTERDPSFQELLVQIEARQAEYQPPRSLFDLWGAARDSREHSRKPGHTLSPLLLLSLLLPVLVRDKPSWLLLGLGVSTFVVIGAQTHLVRYGVIAYPILAAGAGAAIGSVRHKGWQVGWSVVLLAILTFNLSSEWPEVRRHRVGTWLSGNETRIEWLRLVGYNGATEMPGMIQAIQEAEGAIDHEGTILMLGEAKFNLLGFQARPDISRTAVPWLAYLVRNEGNLDRVQQDLWSDGVRYLLVNLAYFGWVARNVSIDVEEYVLSIRTLQEFMQTRATLMIDGPGIILLRIDPPNAQPVLVNTTQ